MKIYLSQMNDFKDLCGLNRLWSERREQVLRYLHPKDKARSLAAGLMMSFVLGITDDSQIQYNPFGKPYLSGSPEYSESPDSFASSVHFNLSHSGDYIVLAVDENEVGIDIEKILPYSDDIARKCFVSEEYRWLKQQKDVDSFYMLWTAKESVMKACGKGLQMPPESFNVLPVEDGPHLIDGKIWFLSWQIHDGHQICVASEKEISEINIISLSKTDLLNRPEETV
ncbi:4'-phosphopantetheinyl transferase superfamily protein [Methanimicrococcus sp. OttesenSCG-928-J09]|nr:4'-phosphopantetheinyl transferase superfamily protein [Methanimicrococcus sp. OttesenSCG-928-J09]